MEETATERFGPAAAVPRATGVEAPTAAEAAEGDNAQMASSRFHSVASKSFSQTGFSAMSNRLSIIFPPQRIARSVHNMLS